MLSFRTFLRRGLMLATLVPALLLGLPLIWHIRELTLDNTQQELRQQGERMLLDVQHEMDTMHGRLLDAARDQDLILALDSPFFSYRVISLTEELLRDAPMLEAIYLLDDRLQLLQAQPESVDGTDMSRLQNYVRQHLQRPGAAPGWLLVQDRPLLRQLFRMPRHADAAADGRLLLLVLPVRSSHYSSMLGGELKGVLVAALPVQRLQQVLRQRARPGQQVSLHIGEPPASAGMRLSLPLRLRERMLPRPLHLLVQQDERVLNQRLARNVLLPLLGWLAGMILALWLARRAAVWLSHPVEGLLRRARVQAQGGRVGSAAQPWHEFAVVTRALQLIAEQSERQLQQLRDSNRRLRQADAIRDEFLARTAQEVRTPLQGIIAINTSLAEGPGRSLPSSVRHSLQLIDDSARRLDTMLADVHDLSRLRHHALTLELRPLSLGSLADLVCTMLEPEAARLGVRLISLVPAELSPVTADEQRLQQILRNLLGLLLRRGGVHSVWLQAQPVSDAAARGLIEIVLLDDGGPLDEADWQAASDFDTALPPGAHGLGLAPFVTRELLHLHGSTLRIHAGPDPSPSGRSRQRRFSFVLPTAALHAAATPEGRLRRPAVVSPLPARAPDLAEAPSPLDSSAPQSVSLPTHVLLVDDEAVNLQIISHYLADEPWQLHVARSGAEALQLLEQMPAVDLILLDIMMPHMSGFEVCCRLRADPRFASVPILFLTARAQAGDIQHAFHYGCNDYLVKPVSRAELLTRCQYHLHFARVQRELHALRHGLQQELERQTAALDEHLQRQDQLRAGWQVLVDLALELNEQLSAAQAMRHVLQRYSPAVPGLQLALYWNGQWYGSPAPLAVLHLLEDRASPASDEALEWPRHDCGCLPMPAAGGGPAWLLYWPLAAGTAVMAQLQLLVRMLSLFLSRQHQLDSLQQMQMLDRETGVWNARFYLHQVQLLEHARQRNPQRQWAVVAIAIDQLLAIRHMFGAAAATALVRQLTQVLQAGLRQNDVVCRMDDDVFAVLLEGTLEECSRLCQRLGQQAAAIRIEHEGADGTRMRLSGSYSVGLASTSECAPSGLWQAALARLNTARAQAETVCKVT